MKKILTIALLAGAFLFCLWSCSRDQSYPPETYVLVHGAWQGPYVWQTVKQQLEEKGQKVVVIELPAHGTDQSAPGDMSIDVYSNTVIKALNSIPGKVILVGHSMGGVVITDVAEKVPQKIKKLVYVGAFLPANGQSLLDLALQDTQSLLGPSLIPSKDQLTLDVIRENVISIFCQDASPAIQQEVLNNFRVEPAIPFTNKVALTKGNFGKVDKYYIKTAEDHAIGPQLQEQMIAAADVKHTYTLQSGHCPFLSQPENVTGLLLLIGK